MPFLHDWLVATGVFLLAVAVGYLLRSLITAYALPWAARRSLALTEVILRALRGFLPLWLALAGVSGAAKYLRPPFEVALLLDQAVAVVLIASLTLFAFNLVSRAVRLYGERMESVRPIAGMVERTCQVVIIALGGLTLVNQLNAQAITPLLTGLGVAGLATALALQDTLANFFAGLYVLADRPVRVGDYVRLESGVEGYVLNIGWRSTHIRTLANNVTVIPNQRLAQSVVTNYFLGDKTTTFSLLVRVPYTSDPDQVERALLEVAAQAVGEVDGLLAEPMPVVSLNPGFGDFSLDFNLVVPLRQVTDQYLVQHELRKRVIRRFRAEGMMLASIQPLLAVAGGPTPIYGDSPARHASGGSPVPGA